MAERTRWMDRLLAAAFVGCLLGCGGGGSTGASGAPEVKPTLVDGTYMEVRLDARAQAGGAVDGTASWGLTLADGMGSLTGTRTTNDGAQRTGPAAQDARRLTLDAARALGVSLASDPDVLRTTGGLRRDGRVAILGGVRGGEPPSASLLLRLEGASGNDLLDGAYHLGAFALTENLGGAEGATGTLLFNGAGGGSSALTVNTSGSVSTSNNPFVYQVAADGRLSLSFGTPLQGGVLADGEVAVLAGADASPNADLALLMLLRKTTTADTTLLDGHYHIIGLELDGGGGIDGRVGRLTADGIGGLSVAFSVRNDDGTVSGGGGQSATYTVGTDGTLSVTSAGRVARGGISADGEVAFFSGPLGNGDLPTFFVLIRFA